MSTTNPISVSHFTNYLEAKNLPVREVSVGGADMGNPQMVLVEHAPNAGAWFEPIEDLVLSIVMRSDHSLVERDVGFGKAELWYRPGTLLITPPGSRSYWRFEGYPQVLHFSVPRAWMHAFWTGEQGLDRALEMASRASIWDPVIGLLAKRMWASRRNVRPGQASLVDCGVGVILGLALEGYPAAATARQIGRKGVSPLPAWQLKKVMQELEERRLKISIAALAASLNLSRDHFIRTFKAATGVSPYEMATKLCMDRAKQMLSDPDLSVTRIALQLGFSSSAHFATRFRLHCGASPTQWRATQTSAVLAQARTGAYLESS